MSTTTKTLKLGLSSTDKTNMASSVTAETLNKMIPTFSTSESYERGQYVIYNNELYRFASNKEAGAWDVSLVNSVTLNDLIYDVNRGVTMMENASGTISSNTTRIGTLETNDAKQDTSIDNLNDTVGMIQEQIASGTKDVPYNVLAYETQFPDNITYDNIVYKRNKNINTAIVKKIGGMSYKYNQLVQNGNFESTSNWSATNCSFSVSDNVASITATAQNGNIRLDNFTSVANHKYLVIAKIKLTTATTNVVVINNVSGGTQSVATASSTNWQTLSVVATASSSGNSNVIIRDERSSDWDTIQIAKVMLIDLTEIYGSSNEPSTYAEFIADYPKYASYVAYTTGAIDNASVPSFDVLSKNLLDNSTFVKGRVDNGIISYANETTSLTITDTGVTFTTASNYRGVASGLIKVIPNATYYISYDATDGAYGDMYDINENWISRANLTYISSEKYTFTTASNCAFIRISFQKATIGTTTISNIMLNKGSTAETYTPYVAPLNKPIPDEVKTLTGYGLGIDSSLYNFIEFDYANNKVYFKAYAGIVDLSGLDYTYNNNDNEYTFYSVISDMKISLYNVVNNIICNKYNATTWINNRSQSGYDKTIATGGNTVSIRDSAYTDITTFKTAMSGVYLIYPLENPVITDVTSYFTSGFATCDILNRASFRFNNTYACNVPNEIDYKCYDVESAIIEGDSTSDTTLSGVTLSDEYIHYQQTSSSMMFVVAGKLTLASTVSAGDTLLTSAFTIEESAGQYIYPIETENNDYRIVDCSKDVMVNPTTLTTNADVISVLEKAVGSNTSMRYRMVANESIASGSYVFRFAISLKL